MVMTLIPSPTSAPSVLVLRVASMVQPSIASQTHEASATMTSAGTVEPYRPAASLTSGFLASACMVSTDDVHGRIAPMATSMTSATTTDRWLDGIGCGNEGFPVATKRLDPGFLGGVT